MPDSPLTQRDVESLRSTLGSLTATLQRIEERVEAIYVRKDVYILDMTNLRRDVDEHSRWLEWAQRIVIGLVIVALVSLVVASNLPNKP